MKLLSDLFTLDSNILDKRITTSLFEATQSLINGSKLTLTAMGRALASDTNKIEKHSIKRMDRLLGNSNLHKVVPLFYQKIQSLFMINEHPLIHIDWSTVYNYDFVMLRAAISFEGRAVTIYEEVHPEEKQNNHSVHKQFLANLARIIPANCQPIICTDAGFKVPWFKEIEKLSWHWLARTRGTVKCQLEGESDWSYVSEYHAQATSKATELPTCKLSKSNQHVCRGVLFKRKNKQRHNLNRKGIVTKESKNKKHGKSAREPWFLVSNLPEERFKAHQLVNIYKRRMAIEESFRDSKNEYYGLGLSRSLSRSVKRLQVILLLAMMAQLYLYCIGKAAEIQGYHRHFQANTISDRRVLSYGYLALRLLKHSQSSRYKITNKMLLEALKSLIEDSLCY